MSAPEQLTEVKFSTFHSTWPRQYPGHISVEMVSGIEISERDYFQDVAHPDGSERSRTLKLPTSWIDGLIGATTGMYNWQAFNCHRFTKRVLGIPWDGSGLEGMPIVKSVDGLDVVDTVSAGEVGIIGVNNQTGLSSVFNRVFHSLLGTEDGLSLQVMDAAGELAFADTRDVVGYYRIGHPDASLYLMD
jgi:hypothetical protein